MVAIDAPESVAIEQVRVNATTEYVKFCGPANIQRDLRDVGHENCRSTDFDIKVKDKFHQLREMAEREREDHAFPKLPLCDQSSECVCLNDRDSAVTSLRCLQMFYRFGVDTFATAVHLLDRFLSRIKVKRKYLSCVTAATYFLSAKFHEDSEEGLHVRHNENGGAVCVFVSSSMHSAPSKLKMWSCVYWREWSYYRERQFVHLIASTITHVAIMSMSTMVECLSGAARNDIRFKETPTATELSHLHQFVWKPSDLKRMELIVLEKLGWELWSHTTPLSFLRIIYSILQLLDIPGLVRGFFETIAKLLEICLNHTICAHFRPCTLAVCALQYYIKHYGPTSIMINFLLLDVQNICQIADSEMLDCYCAVSKQLLEYDSQVLSSPPSLPVPKPISRSGLRSRLSFYENSLPTIDEVGD